MDDQFVRDNISAVIDLVLALKIKACFAKLYSGRITNTKLIVRSCDDSECIRMYTVEMYGDLIEGTNNYMKDGIKTLAVQYKLAKYHLINFIIEHELVLCFEKEEE